MMKLELKNLTKSYEKGKIALDHFSAALEPGVYGLLGPNGAGKSTLMNLITQNLEPDEGEILVNGISATKMGASYRDVLGYMPQQQGLYDRFSALEFLRYFASLKGLKAKESRKRIEELLEVVNLTKARNRKLGGFSGGMKQRVLLAQALLNEPQILILDEPTAGLDPKERIRIRNYISSISENKIVLIATHVVSDVECIAKEILFLRGGKLLEKETPEKLVEQMDGLVWEVIIRSDQLSQLEQVLLVSNVNIAKEGLLVRVITESEQMKAQQPLFGWGSQKGCCPNIGRCISISNGSRQQTLRKLKIWIKITDRFISACYFYGTTQIEKASVLSFVVTHLWTGTFYAPPDVFSLKSSNILSSRSISSFSGFFVNSDFTRESKRELSVKSSRKD